MQEKIALKKKQVIPLLLIFLLPAVFSILAISIDSEKVRSSFSVAVEWSVVALCLIIGFTTSFFMHRRNIIKIDYGRLIIKHGFYTIDLKISDFPGLDYKKLSDLSELKISFKKNGIAGFGYYSGHFVGQHNEDIFCAISDIPIYLFELKTHSKFRSVAVSCSENMASEIINMEKAFQRANTIQ